MAYKPIKNIIFDIDGTLINSYDASLATLRQSIIKATGINYSDDVLYAHFGVPLKNALNIIGIDPKYHQEIAKINDELFPDMIYLVKPFDGIESMLEQLKNRNTPLGLVTSESLYEFNYIFKPLSISKYFDNYVVADDTINHKPSADPLILMMNRLGFEKDETIYIGDAPYDSEACKNAGIRFGLALWGTLKPDIPADYYFKTPNDVLDLFK